MSFFSIFLSSNHQFSLKLRTVIASNNVLHLVEAKLTKKILTVQIWAKIGPEIEFLAIVSSLVHSFSFKLYRMIPWKNIQLLAQVKSTKKKKKGGGGWQIWTKQVKMRPKISFFCHFLKFGLLVFLEIAQSDSLEQFLTTSRGKTHKKIEEGQILTKQYSFGPKTVPFSLNCQFFFKLYRMIAWNNV